MQELLTREGDLWLWGGGYDTRHIPKSAGFRWNPEAKRWQSTDAMAALALIEYAAPDVRDELEAVKAEAEAVIEESTAVTADIDVPAPPDLAYLPYQLAGISFILGRKNTLLADEMGLGKTIQAIGLINATDATDIVIVCPASLKLNWQNELDRWQTRDLPVTVVNPKDQWPSEGIRIVNYDILGRFDIGHVDLLIADEIHFCKNPKTKRSKALYGIEADRRVYLTGTPIVNRPAELWPIINSLDPESWPKFFPFAKTYCDAYQGRFGWDFSGADLARLPELQARLRSTIMVRRVKSEVLTDLPAKVRQVVELPPNGASAIIAAEAEAEAEIADALADARKALADADPDTAQYVEAVAKLREVQGLAFSVMAKVRHETALAKVPHVIEAIEAASGPVVVFAHHKDVIAKLADATGGVIITGDVSQADRQLAVEQFQNGDVDVFIGSIQAAGVGLTLTRSSHVIFAELDWVPGNVSQAEDRCHRIGQQDSVLVQHLVFDGSIDAKMAKTIVRKQNAIDAATDPERVEMPEAITEEIPEPEAPRPFARPPEVPVDPVLEQAALDGLRIVSAYCDGAVARDGMGFSGMDTNIGKSLASQSKLTARQYAVARKLVIKYHRQIPEPIVALVKGDE